MTVLLIAMPIVFLLLFVYVFGGELSHGLDDARRRTPRTGRVPQLRDSRNPAPDRGRNRPRHRDRRRHGHDRRHHRPVPDDGDRAIRRPDGPRPREPHPDLGSVVIVIGIAIALGFRPTAGLAGWLAAFGVIGLFAFALVWLATALGLAAKSVETASNSPMILTLLPFLGSGFVPAATMPTGLAQFARYQPFTPVTETLRGLLTGTPIGTNAIAATAWSVGIALVAYLRAIHLYKHRKHR